MQEILLIILIIVVIFYLPRLTARRQDKSGGNGETVLTGRTRLAIAASGVWPILSAVYFEPWNRNPLPFLYFGIGPVLTAWVLAWVIRGYRKDKR